MENYFVNGLEYLYIPHVNKCINGKSDDEGHIKPDDSECGTHTYCKYCKYCKHNVINPCVDPEQDDTNDMNRETNVIQAILNGEPRPEETCDCHDRIEDLYINCNEHECDCGE